MKSIFFSIISIVIGAYINDLIYRKNNERLLAELKAQLEANNKARMRATTEHEKEKLKLRDIELRSQIKIIEKLYNGI